MTHGSVVYSSGTWESKLGRYLRITHKRSELSGTLYGRILVSFIESRTKTDMSEIKELAKQIAQEDIELLMQKNKLSLIKLQILIVR